MVGFYLIFSLRQFPLECRCSPSIETCFTRASAIFDNCGDTTLADSEQRVASRLYENVV